MDTTGTYVYYVAGSEAWPNSVMKDVVSRETRRIAELSPDDSPDSKSQENHHDVGELTARVSGNGHYLAFVVQQEPDWV